MHSLRTAPVPERLADAIAQLRDIVVELCALVTKDPQVFTRHYALIDANLELQGRDAVKSQRQAELLADILIGRGAEPSMAGLASQVALACYQAARRSAEGDLRRLVDDTALAFDRVLRLGEGA
jgi:hypothetical protein